MRTLFGDIRNLTQSVFYKPVNLVTRYTLALRAQEKGPVGLAEPGCPGLKILLKTVFQIITERYETLLVTFTGNLDGTGPEINIPVIKTYQLGHTHPCLIEGGYHGPVPDPDETLTQIQLLIVQKPVHIGLLYELGQWFLVLGAFYTLNRRTVRDSLYAKEPVEGTQGAQLAVDGGGFLSTVHHVNNPEAHHIPVGREQIKFRVSLLKECQEKVKVLTVTGYCPG